ncbi:MAG TPA: hypothetical protein VHD90_09310 [Phototrophicaceae bacterium]|nr:hypothetical protein [Phototrophicaceae bacterium]
MEPYQCQIRSVPHLSEGKAPLPPLSLGQRLKLILKTQLSPTTKRALKQVSDNAVHRLRAFDRKPASVEVVRQQPTVIEFKPGDWVRVRSREEIEATLSSWGELKGCGFMAEMLPYCGTTQRVFKSVRRFVDERDYQPKRCRGLVLLEGVICEGTTLYGPCDRSCYYFWREEWLEKLN